MKAILVFFKAWLFLCFVLTFFVVPFYLMAIYPEVPEPYYRFIGSIGYSVLHVPPSPMAFAYRFASCGSVVLMGMFVVWIWLRDARKIEGESKDKEKRNEK
ncbi:hypothetical protein SAMN05216350_106220 [Polaromonas sp. YR568]|uniref:hypothetical protein n=1 Tax=Polaromonas sp. YR568 TaxID=1855301 RepID=UPI0008E06B42|nr:hypothetical protein [Polaromonas sp. YR568]SFU85589.1 hypothetical protein SAMN05216350_106220 [Polaromonas sp. YR568]